MTISPELRRNLWLEVTPQRLVVIPMIVGCLVAAVCVVVPREMLATRLLELGVVGFVLTTLIWGASLVAASQNDEFVAGTWDGQRLSGLSAWALVIGKLFGGAAAAWYAGAWCLVVMLATIALGAEPASVLCAVVELVAAAVLTQSDALLFTLNLWRKARATNTIAVRAGSRSWALALVFAGLLLKTSGGPLETDPGAEVGWFGLYVNAQLFVLLSVILYAAWALHAAQLLMRCELQQRNSSGWAIGFLLFTQIYVAGLLPASALLQGLQAYGVEDLSTMSSGYAAVARTTVAAIVALAFGYVLVFAEPKQFVQLRRVFAQWRAGDLGSTFSASPLWLRTLLQGFVTAIVAMFVALVWLERAPALLFVAGAMATLLFVMRDIAIVLACNLGESQRRADAAAITYLLVMYALLPMLFSLIVDSAWVTVFTPFASFASPVWLLAAVAWAAGALWLLHQRWQTALHRHEVPPARAT